LIIAFKIENKFSKDEILLKYLNAIYFGRGAYGIETAANQYFDKSASELTVAESIVLASIIRSPGRYDPSSAPTNVNNLRNRFLAVKKLMLEQGWISQSIHDAMQFPEIAPRKNLNTFVGVTGHIMEEVRKELYVRGFNEDQISKGGLVIDRQQLLGCCQGHGMEACAGPAGEQNTLHDFTPPSLWPA
ncbi:MAG: hypothetical protein EBT34_06190, partial [Acetobacteraceae bacterium]|nr:hypothetical protein [Acetobacteraceae bacterium]